MRQLKSAIAAGAAILGAVLVATNLDAAQAQGSGTDKATGHRIKAVLELFTSQGCSSCPPADALMKDLSARKDLIALSFPVDYWDYLGWKDTLANPKFSARQRYYAKRRGDGKVYTPQMVVSGRTHVIGSSAANIEAAISSTGAELDASRVPISIMTDDRHIIIETGEAPPAAKIREATIWLAMARREVKVEINRGENRGKSITYYNVVRDFSPIGMWDGKPGRLQLARDAVTTAGNEELCAVIIQVGKAGPIIGAAALDGL